jgi:hypothetical protein
MVTLEHYVTTELDRALCVDRTLFAVFICDTKFNNVIQRNAYRGKFVSVLLVIGWSAQTIKACRACLSGLATVSRVYEFHGIIPPSTHKPI